MTLFFTFYVYDRIYSPESISTPGLLQDLQKILFTKNGYSINGTINWKLFQPFCYQE